MVKRSFLMGLVMAVLPTVFVEAYRALGAGLTPRLDTLDVVLVLLMMAVSWGLVWWMVSRKERFSAAELFLAGAFSWVMIGLYYRALFGRPGGVALVFGVFAAIYHWFPLVSGRPMVKRWGRTHFWITFICALAFFHPVADFWYRWQGYIDLTYLFFDNGAFWHFWKLVGLVGQGVFVVNLVYSVAGHRKSVD